MCGNGVKINTEHIALKIKSTQLVQNLVPMFGEAELGTHLHRAVECHVGKEMVQVTTLVFVLHFNIYLDNRFNYLGMYLIVMDRRSA